MRTQQRRPDLMDRLELNAEQQNILKEMRNALADDGNG
jgi:tRNA (guanine37-N1)-methyltransferase